MFAEKVENYPTLLKKLEIGQAAKFDRQFRNRVQKAVQRLRDEGYSFRIVTKNDVIMVNRVEYIVNSCADEVIKGLSVGEFFTRPLSKELESVSIIQDIKDKKFNIIRDHSCGQLVITRIE